MPAPAAARSRPTIHNNAGLLFTALGLDVVFGLWVAAQYTAWRFAYHPNLGSPTWVAHFPVDRYILVLAVLGAGVALALLAVRGLRRLSLPLLLAAAVFYIVSAVPLYSPLRYVFWARAYGRIPVHSGIITDGAYALAVGVGVAFLVTAAAVGRRRPAAASGSHGTAAWGRGEALRVAAQPSAGAPAGLLVGREDGELLTHRGEGSLITIAPARTGKGTSAIIPNLLTYPGSMLVVDPKDGENYHVTAAARRALGQRVIALDPFGVAGGLGTHNPMALIDGDSPEAGDDADLLADMLVVADARDTNESTTHFQEIARTVIAGVTLHVATTRTGPDRSLPTVRRLLAQPDDRIEALFREMLRNPAAGGQVASAAATVLQAKERERGSIMTTVLRHTRFLESPRMQAILGHESGNFDFADLKRGGVTIYLVLPARHISGKHKRWLRLMITCALRAITDTPGHPAHPILFVLDEFGNLGRMQPVADAITLAGGYGVRFWPFFQDHSQGEEVYGKRWKTFLAGAEVKQIFGVSDLDTAKYWSEYLGDSTISVESENRSKGRSSSGGLASGSYSAGTAQTTSERGRRLLTPDEILRLPRDRQLLIVRGEQPIHAEKLDYRADLEFQGRFAPNPMYAPPTNSTAAAPQIEPDSLRLTVTTSAGAEIKTRVAEIRTLVANEGEV